MTIAAFRVPRDILGNPVPRCCLRTHAEVRRFIRPTHHLPASLMDGLCEAGRQAGMAAQITAYFFLYPFVLSFRRAPSERGTMRCAFVQWSQFARRVRPRPPPSPFFRPLAALINRAAQTSGSHHSVHAPCSVVCSFAFTVAAAASFLNPVTVRK